MSKSIAIPFTAAALAFLLPAPSPAKSKPSPAIELAPLSTFATGVFDGGAAEIVAHDARSQRLFIVNAAAAGIDVLDIRDPSAPVFVQTIDISAFGSQANSVAVHNGLVAAAVQASVSTDPGSVLFFDVQGRFLKALTVGAQPDMLTFTPDGKKILVANEGEASGGIDPQGSVSIINLTKNAADFTQASVKSIDFTAFNLGGLDPAVRIFPAAASVAQDLEPEYIAVSPDSKTAFVTLQEANAFAIIDVKNERLETIRPLGFKDHSLATATLQLFEFGKLPKLGTTAAGQDIDLGGFSGLFFEGWDEKREKLFFITHPDRGPNAEPVDLDQDGVAERPFPLPGFQSQWVRFELDLKKGRLKIKDVTGLTRQDGKTPITGLPNIINAAPGFAYADEEPVDLFGSALPLDPFGADMEGIVGAPDGTYWMVDEYRPALYHFTEKGVLIDRFVPIGSGPETGVEALPAVYAQRRSNRGFEGVAFQNGKVYAFIQSPLDNPDVANDANSKSGKCIRILEFDPATRTASAEYLYVIEGGASDKIGDAVSYGDGQFLVIERDSATGLASKKKVFLISLRGATNLQTVSPALGPIEKLTASDLAANNIAPVSKELYVDLATVGYDFTDKPEGLAFIDFQTIAVLNDNDFKLAGGFDPATGLLDPNPAPQEPILGLIKLDRNGLDASDRDDAINITTWPVSGMFMPDAITSFKAGKETYYITANEGDDRGEDERIKDLPLDPVAFPNAAALQANDALGRLGASSIDGDVDGDGDYDRLFTYGARSFTIWNNAGERVWDSGDLLEQITAALLPDAFNSTNDDNDSADSRSDNKGPEPEGVITGQIGKNTYAFIGLERIGGIMVFDVTNPASPGFVQYINPRNFSVPAEDPAAGDLAPEGLIFISGKDSPTRRPLLVVANEVSGSTTIYSITETK